MAETAPVVHIGGSSLEQIAYKLLETIASNEKKTLHWSVGSNATADRKWLLDTYAEMLSGCVRETARSDRHDRRDDDSAGSGRRAALI